MVIEQIEHTKVCKEIEYDIHSYHLPALLSWSLDCQSVRDTAEVRRTLIIIITMITILQWSHPCSSRLLELPGLLWPPALRSLNSIRLF